MKALRFFAVGLAALACACSPAKPAKAPAPGRTAIAFATDWRAQAEQGRREQGAARIEAQGHAQNTPAHETPRPPVTPQRTEAPGDGEA